MIGTLVPKIKIKDEVMVVSDNSLIRRIENAGAGPFEVNVPRDITRVGFGRNKLAKMVFKITYMTVWSTY